MRALVIGDSGGIGAALSAVLAGQGAQVSGLSRRIDGLDVTDEASVAAVLGTLNGEFDLIFVATLVAFFVIGGLYARFCGKL